MKLQPGYLYHIKDEYFDFINDENLFFCDTNIKDVKVNK